jgi:hypothetical protein
MRKSLGVSLLFTVTCLAVCDGQSLKTEKPMSADEFVDSIGINIHLHNGNTLYGNFPVIFGALRDLGIRHTRDGLINTTWQEYYRRHTQLAASGMHCLFITGPEDTATQIRGFTEKVAGAMEGFEAPNEYDNSGDSDWAVKLSAYMPRLKSVAASISLPGKIPVVGPALVTPDADRKVPGLAASFDEANMHNYFGGHNPGTAGWGDNGYGSISWNVALSEKAWGKKPIITTETGYLTDVHAEQSIDEAVQAVYTPRIFLEQTLHGILRTYLYELADGNNIIPLNERSFGLIRNDGSRKPAFEALQRLIGLLSDPGPAFHPTQVFLQLGPAVPELHHLLFEKRNGVFYLAFWLEDSSFDQKTKKETAVKPVSVTVRVQNRIRSAHLFSLDPAVSAGGIPVSAGKELSLVASANVSILEFDLTH